MCRKVGGIEAIKDGEWSWSLYWIYNPGVMSMRQHQIWLNRWKGNRKCKLFYMRNRKRGGSPVNKLPERVRKSQPLNCMEEGPENWSIKHLKEGHKMKLLNVWHYDSFTLNEARNSEKEEKQQITKSVVSETVFSGSQKSNDQSHCLDLIDTSFGPCIYEWDMDDGEITLLMSERPFPSSFTCAKMNVFWRKLNKTCK